MKCYSLILGARNTRSAGKRFSKQDDRLIRSITFTHFPDGFTILNADGGWFDPQKRRFIEEESRQILVCARGRSELRSWCKELARALVQREFLVLELGHAAKIKIGRTARIVLRF